LAPASISAIADDLEMDSRWQTMSAQSLKKLTAGEWLIMHEADGWKPLGQNIEKPRFLAEVDW
jgi:hypothetical protein